MDKNTRKGVDVNSRAKARECAGPRARGSGSARRGRAHQLRAQPHLPHLPLRHTHTHTQADGDIGHPLQGNRSEEEGVGQREGGVYGAGRGEQ